MSQIHAAAGQPGLTHLDWRGDVKDAARVWAALLLMGVVCGVVVVGAMSRLVMLLLDPLNPAGGRRPAFVVTTGSSWASSPCRDRPS